MLKQELEKNSSKIESFLMTSNGIAIVQLDSNMTILDCNLGFMRLFNPRQSPAGERLSDYLDISATDIRCGVLTNIPCSRKTGLDAVTTCCLMQTDDGYLLIIERMLLTESRALEQMGSMNDELINMQRDVVKKNRQLEKLKSELHERVAELELAITRINRLEGIISVCLYCHKIRTDEDTWDKFEKYLQEHTDAEFSHGICPVCMEEKYHEKK
ncbi:MAG TPA: hypothetical protein HPP97_15695 [Desulfuromonadales bacterium]|nr:hypothetical protein [Desulfuromonadales bacterium]